MEEEEAAEGKSGGGHPVYEERNLSDATSDVAMVDNEQPAASSSSGKGDGAVKHCREATEEKEECAPKDNQARGDRVTSAKLPSMEEKGSTVGAFKPSRYSASADRDPTPVDPSAKELPIEVDLEDLDEDGDKDQPQKDIRKYDGRGRSQRRCSTLPTMV